MISEVRVGAFDRELLPPRGTDDSDSGTGVGGLCDIDELDIDEPPYPVGIWVEPLVSLSVVVQRIPNFMFRSARGRGVR
jgi:hypothetical protein